MNRSQSVETYKANMRRRKFTICFLSSIHPPYDKRVFDKEAISLAKAGFNVIHLAPGEGECIYKQGVKIVTYRRPQDRVRRILQIPRLYRLAGKIEADCYHCNEVDSWLVGVLLKLTRHKKVVFDVHEHYPSTFAEKTFPHRLRPFAARGVCLVFRVLLPFTDRLVFAKRSVAPDFRGSEEKQILVQNFTSLVYMDVKRPAEADRNTADSSTAVIAVHLGLINRMRGWPQLLEALARARSKNLRLHIVGAFNDGSQTDFENRVVELGLDGRVCVEGWMPFEYAYERVLAAHIGLISFQPGIRNHVFALPHKMFDYMLAGLPVIAPHFAKEVASIIKETECGVLLDPSNPDEIAEALDYLVADADERQRLGENGRRAVLERYNWESEAEKLVNMYTEMARNSK